MGRFTLMILTAALACAAAFPLHAEEKKVALDVRWGPTPDELMARMFEYARPTDRDVLYDLGCGDGRIVITAARTFGTRGVGIDIDPKRIEQSIANAKKAGVEDRVSFLQQNLFTTDISPATIVALYLNEKINAKLRPKLFQELKPGTRILSHNWTMGRWQADRTSVIGKRVVYFWVLPANFSGSWSGRIGGNDYSLRIQQRFQKCRGEITIGTQFPVQDAQVTGDRIRFSISTKIAGRDAALAFDGRLKGNEIEGTVTSREYFRKGISEQFPWRAARDRATISRVDE